MLCGKLRFISTIIQLKIFSDDEDYDKVKAEVIKLLKVKYSLEIISEDPLDFKKIEY